MNRKLIGCVGVLILLGAASCGDDNQVAPSTAQPPFAVGTSSQTWVDTSRPTQRNGSAPKLPSRTLRTVYAYPTTGDPNSDAVEGAAPYRSAGPYPLLIFAHGYTGSPELQKDQINALASKGFVVAAPAFPLTKSDAVGGPNGSDVINQPGDVSFVITKTIEAAKGSGGFLAGLIKTDEVAAGGHSAGAMTTLGFTNTCCRDDRVKALYVWAGNEPAFNGTYDFAHTPPILFVHGTKDIQLPYNDMAEAFNQITGPKAFLTMIGEDHASWARKTDNSFDKVLTTTVDFLNVYLRNDAAAKARLEKGENDDQYQLAVALDPGTVATVPLLPAPKLDRKVNVDPATGLHDGQEVTVTWSNFLPDKVVHIVQCSGTTETACETGKGKLFVPDPTGNGSTTFTVYTGPIGDGECGKGKQGCNIVINDASLRDPDASLRVPISFE